MVRVGKIIWRFINRGIEKDLTVFWKAETNRIVGEI